MAYTHNNPNGYVIYDPYSKKKHIVTKLIPDRWGLRVLTKEYPSGGLVHVDGVTGICKSFRGNYYLEDIYVMPKEEGE